MTDKEVDSKHEPKEDEDGSFDMRLEFLCKNCNRNVSISRIGVRCSNDKEWKSGEELKWQKEGSPKDNRMN